MAMFTDFLNNKNLKNEKKIKILTDPSDHVAFSGSDPVVLEVAGGETTPPLLFY